jgi:8-oxo-dGTP pyrophosphatase MutT (NUDIX family)
VARLKSTTATSAGGIVIRRAGGVPQFVAGSRRRDGDAYTWTLPKGTPHPGETTEETALREVAEETGLQVRIVEPLHSISYTFVQRGARVHKTVHYFLMEPTGGDLAGHDREFDEVRWVDLADAGAVLTFESERALIDRAADRIARPEPTRRPGAATAESVG